ncbi:enoyl-CoA hydratase, partial [Klebsiella pneumoniae subsp. pneumoniae KpMDU1]
FLPRVAGRARAMGLALLGDSLSAEQAAQWGDYLATGGRFRTGGYQSATGAHLAAQPTFGLGLIKKALLASETNSLDAQLDLERDYQRLAGRSDDYREGVSAFLAKRPPQFSGK